MSFAISVCICAIASAVPGLLPNICARLALAPAGFVNADRSAPCIIFFAIRASKSCNSFTSGGSGAIHASVVTVEAIPPSAFAVPDGFKQLPSAYDQMRK